MTWLIAALMISASSVNEPIKQLPEVGGTITLKHEIVQLEQPIVIDRDNVTIDGNGATLIVKDGANMPAIIIGDTNTPVKRRVRNIIVKNLIIDGNYKKQDCECYGGECDTGGLTFIRNNGITIRGASDVLITDVEVYGARSGGIVVEKHCERLHIKNCNLHHNYFDGLASCETTDSIFEHINSHHNIYAGISFDIKTDRNIIRHCKLNDNGHQGIFMRDSNDNSFEDLEIYQNNSYGVFIAQNNELTETAAKNNRFLRIFFFKNLLEDFLVKDKSCVGNTITYKPSSLAP